MHWALKGVFACVLMTAAVAATPRSAVPARAGAPRAIQSGAPQQIDLAERLAAGKLTAVKREVTTLQGSRGVHVSGKAAPGLVWIEGTDFGEGTIEVDVRGRDVLQKSFVGIAFHRKDDNTYESVYLRPFNFRADDPARHQYAVQYMASPDYDWPTVTSGTCASLRRSKPGGRGLVREAQWRI
jgi:hypothetical protein